VQVRDRIVQETLFTLLLSCRFRSPIDKAIYSESWRIQTIRKYSYLDGSRDVGSVGVVYPVSCRTSCSVLFNGRESCIVEPSKWKDQIGNEFGFTTYETRRPLMADCPRPRMESE
jgi:hypothetical protein